MYSLIGRDRQSKNKILVSDRKARERNVVSAGSHLEINTSSYSPTSLLSTKLA